MAGPRQQHGSVGAGGEAAAQRHPQPSAGKPRWRHLRSLRLYIVLWTLLPIVVFLLGLSFTDIYGHQRAMRVMVEERDSALVQAVAARIADNLEHNASLLEAVGAGDAFRQGDAAAQAQLLSPLSGTFQGGILLVDGQGRALGAYGAAGSWRSAPFVGPLVQAALGHGRPAYLAAAQEGLPPFHVAVAVPLAGRDGALLGVLPLSRSIVAGAVDGLQTAPAIGAWLVDGQGRLIYRAGQGPLSPQALAAQDSEGVVTTSMPVPGTDWQLVLSEPWHHLLPLVLRYAQATVLIAIAAVFISLLAVYLGVRYVTGPLHELGQQARRMAWGDFEAVQPAVGGVVEIADLQGTLRQMASQVRGYQTAMRSYVAAVTQAQEEERLRLARELHDDTVQSLIALGQQLERMQKSPHVPEVCRAQVEALRQTTRSLVQDVRRLIGNLRPVYLDDLGLAPALEMLVGTVTLPEPAELTIGGEPRRLAPDLELAVYRIVQAALKNIEQHAQARRVRVALDFEPAAVRVVVEDDGVGFTVPTSPDELAREGHFGLLGMRERAVLYGGWVSLSSQPGRGTRLEIYLPSSPATTSA